MKRFIVMTVVVSLVVVAGMMLVNVHPASALNQPMNIVATVEDGTGSGGAVTASGPCEKPRLLGVFVPWYEYLKIGKDDTGSCAVKDFTLLGSNSDIPFVLMAIVDDLLRVAGLVAVIFVIYGGVQYTTSQGSPDATAKAQSTILYALIGLVISLVAIAFVTYIGRAIG